MSCKHPLRTSQNRECLLPTPVCPVSIAFVSGVHRLSTLLVPRSTLWHYRTAHPVPLEYAVLQIRSRTSVCAHPHILEVAGATAPSAADNVDGAGGVDHGRERKSRSPWRAGDHEPPRRAYGHAGDQPMAQTCPSAHCGRSINNAGSRRTKNRFVTAARHRHTQTHTDTHTRHAQTRTHTHNPSPTRTHTRTHTHKHPQTHTHTHTHK
jgi:hypothetical protein